MGAGVSWRLLNAAVSGTSHLRTHIPCQDDCLVVAFSLSGDDVVVAIASDGAGSAQCSQEGSGISCEMFVAAVEAWLRDGGGVERLSPANAEEWLRPLPHSNPS